jgi:hypothetical protein
MKRPRTTPSSLGACPCARRKRESLEIPDWGVRHCGCAAQVAAPGAGSFRHWLATLSGGVSHAGRTLSGTFHRCALPWPPGVGKTRLMGAFIAYLHLAHGINNFFVLAPNLTIYNKLIADFSDRGHPQVRV